MGIVLGGRVVVFFGVFLVVGGVCSVTVDLFGVWVCCAQLGVLCSVGCVVLSWVWVCVYSW